MATTSRTTELVAGTEERVLYSLCRSSEHHLVATGIIIIENYYIHYYSSAPGGPFCLDVPTFVGFGLCGKTFLTFLKIHSLDRNLLVGYCIQKKTFVRPGASVSCDVARRGASSRRYSFSTESIKIARVGKPDFTGLSWTF